MAELRNRTREILRSLSKDIRTFRDSLIGYDQQLFDELLGAALGTSQRRKKGAMLSREAKEVIIKDIGPLRIEMKGDYQTCGGDCSVPKSNKGGEIWCTKACSGDVAPDCSCHLYRYKTPKPGDDPPPKKDWEHVWKPGDDELPKKEKGYSYECVCVRPKKK